MTSLPAGAAADLAARPHATTTEQMAATLGVDPGRGLSEAEAGRRLRETGPNLLTVTPPPSFWALLLRQFQSLLILILLAAAGLALVVGDPQDAAVILAVVILNALIGAVQEARAEQALAGLREMSAPTARVLREGGERTIPAAGLTPGDIAIVRAGDLVPADGRLLAATSLEADESNLTGESLPEEKDAAPVLPAATPLADRVNLLFLGTAITQGHGRLLVTATGPATEMGQLARTVSEAKTQPTPLEQQIAWLGKVLSLLALAAAGAVLALGLLRGEPLEGMILVALSLAVAAVPEGLPAVVTIVLAIGVQRMARRHAIVRRLAAVEALGAATVICTDKTGTLTLGEMRASVVALPDRRFEVRDGALWEGNRPAAPEQEPGLADLLRAAALCNNAHLGPTPAGDPTERALLLLVHSLGLDRAALQAAWPRTGEIPFSSDRKRMTTVHQHGADFIVYVKGAPDVVLAHCSQQVTRHGPAPLSAEAIAALHADLERLASQGLRLLALAQRHLETPPGQPNPHVIERDLTLLGMVGLSDPPRPEAAQALAAARAAGIRVIMMTGDHPVTASAIAGQLGIEGAALTGAELAQMTPAQAGAAATATGVYARLAPQQKVDIVQTLQRAGNVAAMTGDGANDAPALRLADIGVAMGIRGTAVAKEAAAIVLANDNFASIVAAIEEGRTIYGNLQKVVVYLVAGNLGEVLLILLAMLMGLPLPLQPVQILWVNLVTDSLPAVGLGMEPREPGTMKRPPRAPGEPFLPRWLLPLIGATGLMMALITLAAFTAALERSPSDLAGAQSAVFTTVVFARLGIGWALRSLHTPALALSARSNRVLLLAVLAGAAGMLALLYTPFGHAFFHTLPLDLESWLITAALAPLPFLAAELIKRRVAGRQ